MLAFLLAFFCSLSISTTDHSSFFNGNWYLNLGDKTEKSTLMIKLNFYKKKKESGQYFLELLDETAKDIIKNENNNENLFVLGSMQLKKFNRSTSLQDPKILIAGFFKSETNQLFLIHSLQHFLTNKIINDINISEPLIIKNTQLITFLSSIESIYANKFINEPNIDDLDFNNSNLVDQLQSYANNEFTNFDGTVFPLIYLQLLRTNTAPKIFDDCRLHGLIISDITTSPNTTTNFININLYQFDMKLLNHKSRIYSYIYLIFFFIQYTSLLILSSNYNVAQQISFISLSFRFLPFYVFEKNAFYDFEGNGFLWYKQVHYICFIIIIVTMLYRKFLPILKSLINGKINPSVEKITDDLFIAAFLLVIYYYINRKFNFNHYSILAIIFFFFNSITELEENTSPITSIYEIIGAFCSLFGIGLHYLLYKNDILIDKYDIKLFLFALVYVTGQAISEMVTHIKNGFSPIALYNEFFPYDYYKKKAKNGIKCRICNEKMIPSRESCVVTPCNHAFHEKCFIKLIEDNQNATCPACDAYLPPLNEKEHDE